MPASAKLPATRLICLFGLILALGYLVALGGAYLQGHFLTDTQGQPIANDFVNVWAAGRLALEDDPAAAYDWTLHKAAEVRAVGHPFANYYGWHYPPTFLFIAAVLAMLPYLVAALVWLVATLAAYAAALGGILGGRAAGQVPQDLLDARALRLDARLALAHGCVGVEMHGLVDDRELVLIVQIALVGGDLAVDLDPELHVRLELGRSRDQVLCRHDMPRQHQQTEQQA